MIYTLFNPPLWKPWQRKQITSQFRKYAKQNITFLTIFVVFPLNFPVNMANNKFPITCRSATQKNFSISVKCDGFVK